MKYILLSFILCYSFYNSYAQENALELSPLIGFRLHTNGLPGLRTGAPPRLITAPMFGMNISLKDKPFSLSIEKDWNLKLNSYEATSLGNIGQYWTETRALLNYRLKNFDFNLGYFYMERENSNHFELGDFVVRNYQGLLLGIHKEFDWLGVGLRTRITLDPFFDALVGIENYNLILSYRFGKDNYGRKQTSIFDNKFQLRVNIGMRFFPVKGIEVLTNETFPRIGISPTLGGELLHVKTGLSFNVEKDIWVSLNGGSPQREVKGYIVSTLIGGKYHVELKNTRYLRLGLGYSLILDLDKMTIKNTGDFSNYHVKGLGASVSYELIPNTDIELKHTFSIKSIDDESLFSPIRFSGGIIYRIQPK